MTVPAHLVTSLTTLLFVLFSYLQSLGCISLPKKKMCKLGICPKKGSSGLQPYEN